MPIGTAVSDRSNKDLRRRGSVTALLESGSYGVKPMTESEWLACNDPEAMLTFLRNNIPVPDRDYRRFALECCRRILERFPTSRNRVLLALAEEYLEDPNKR